MTVAKTRRGLLTGEAGGPANAPDNNAEIVSLIVNIFPAHLETVSKAFQTCRARRFMGRIPRAN